MDSKWIDARWAMPELGHEVEFFDKEEKLHIGTYCAPEAYTDKTPMFYSDAHLHRAEQILCWRYAPSYREISISQTVEMTRRVTVWH